MKTTRLEQAGITSIDAAYARASFLLQRGSVSWLTAPAFRRARDGALDATSKKLWPCSVG